ncbi:MAG TPA: hypothetical protein VGB22_01150, partial [candidate division Zixibacteria bacterium]
MNRAKRVSKVPAMVALAAIALLSTAVAAQAAVSNLVFGPPYAAASSADHGTAQQFTGAGSWSKTYPAPKLEMYIDPLAQFGQSFTIGEIANITYHTVNDGTNPSGVDFYLLIYTLPYVGGDASWYGNRLNAEPLYSNSYVAPSAWVWNTWNTDAGTNQLTYFDANHCGNFGFYGGPTLQDIAAGDITWSSYPGAGVGADPTPIDYSSQTVLYLNISTGSGWSSFNGHVDALEIHLTTGDSFLIDLESSTDPVYVDDDWAGTAPGVEVESGKFFGYNAFATVQDGVDNVANSTVYVADGTYEEQVVITEDLDLIGSGPGTVILSPTSLSSSFSSGVNNFPIVMIEGADNVSVQNLVVDGAGRGNGNYRFVGIGFHNAGGLVDLVELRDIRETPFNGNQHGVAVYSYNDDGIARSIEVANCDIHDFQKNGMALNAAANTPLDVNVHDNTVTGYGPTDITAQNGIQVFADLATGSVEDNVVADIAYDNTNSTIKWVATSILNYFGGIDIGRNTVTGGHVGIYNFDGEGTIDENNLTIEKIGVYAWGIIASDPNHAIPAPFAAPEEAAKGADFKSAAALLVVDILRNIVTFSGGDNTVTFGIEADGGFGPDDLAFTANENIVTGFEVGIEVFECQSSCGAGIITAASAYSNSLGGNTIGMRSNWSGGTVDGSANSWGSVDPGVVAGQVVGDIDYTPWLDAIDSDGGTAGFQGDFSSLWVDDDSPQTGAENRVQEGVNLVTASTVYVVPGNYPGQVIIDGYTNLNLIGSGVGVSTIEATASMTHSFVTPGPNSNYAVISAENSSSVAIQDLTVDGLGLGNSNYRFIGIGYRNAGGSVSGCEVKDVRNTPIDGSQHGVGIYGFADDGNARTLLVTDNDVFGFQKNAMVLAGADLTAHATLNDVSGAGPVTFIAQNGIQLSNGAQGSIYENDISGFSYTPATFASAGVLIFSGAGLVATTVNSISECQVGVWYIDASGNIDGNTVTATTAGMGATPYWWNIIADPGVSTKTPPHSGYDLDATAGGHQAAGIQALTTSVSGNIVDGDGNGVGIGAYVFGTETMDFSADDNKITNFDVGMELYRDPTAALSSIVTSNRLYNSNYGLANYSGTVDAQFNIFSNTTNADDDTPGNYYNENCWSDYSGTPPYPVGGAGANVDNNPNVDCGLLMSPDAIAYDCSGDFTFDVLIGEIVEDLAGAEIKISYPSSLTVDAVTTSVPDGVIFFWGQTSHPSGNRDTLQVIFTMTVGSLYGPETIFSVTMSGTESCLDDEIKMVARNLWHPGFVLFPVPLAGPIALTTDCEDPVFTFNGPADGLCFNTVPSLDISASDDCDLDAVYYQYDGCDGAGWTLLAGGLSGTAYSNAAWALAGFAGLSDGNHCVYFKVVDDFGHVSSDTCSFSWCFTKDVTPPDITCPDDYSVECEAEITACDPGDATATDNIGGVTITCADGPLVGGPCGGTVTRTYTATDDCGNSSECDQIITVEDQTPPTVTCMLDIDVQRFVDLPPCDVLDATVTDNCGPVTVVCERSSVGGVGCTDVSVPITYTYTATDACGNEAFCERVVTVLRPDCPFFVAAGDVSSPVDVAVGGRTTIPIRLDSAQSDVGSFELAFAYDDEVFSIAQVERGSALADWEYFTYRLETGVIRLIAIADLANGAMHPPSSAYRPVGVLANVTVNVTPDRSLAGQSVYWQTCLDGCTDNTISSRTGDMTFVMAESDYENCAASLSGSVLPGVQLGSAQMRIVEPAGSRGDINQNGLSYEVGDAILLVNYLINGVEVFSEDAALRALQVQAGDVNGDGVSLTVADLTYLIRVISGAVSPTIEAKLSPYAGSATV